MTSKNGVGIWALGENLMGDESKDWQVWLDEYNTYSNDIGDITIDLDDFISAHSNNTITVGNGWSDDYNDWLLSTFNEPKHDNISLTGGGEEMLRVAPDGFYVRGVRVEADAKEAEQVYKAFKEWLTWANLSKHNE